jgi:hypothetical protein
MKNPRSSSQGSSVPPTGAWYREPWPWILIAGPLVVVIACMATTVIAVRSDDGMVARDYYKRGLLVNQQLPKGGVVTAHLAATVAMSPGGEIRLHPEAGDPQGDFLRVTLSHPDSGARETLSLRRNTDGDFVGTLAQSRPGRWIVAVESSDWPLPTTLIERGRDARVATSPSIR